MAQEIGRDDGVALAQPGNHVLPRCRVARDPVQEDHEGAAPGSPIAELVTVEGDLGAFPTRGRHVAGTSKELAKAPKRSR